MKVIICDDEPSRCREVKEAIQESELSDVQVVELAGRALTEELSKLFETVERCLDRPESDSVSDVLFQDADLAIFDNNLAHLQIKGTRLTAESVVGYLRAFTAVPYVVSLNKNPDVDFDLRYLVGDYETRADVALNTNHLENPALWMGKAERAEGDFIPWYWPQLGGAPDRRRDQIEFVMSHLSDSVLRSLQLPTDDETLAFLSLHAKGALSSDAQPNGGEGDGIPIEDVTFRDVFAARSRSLPVKADRKKLIAASKAGNQNVRQIIARVVAADIDLWFRRDVIGPQELLVDVPHLLERMPFLLGEKVNEIEAWNHAIAESKSPFGMDESLFHKHLANARFEHDIWVPTPAFRWPALKSDDALNDLFFSSIQDQWPAATFCEDRSRFLQRSEKNGAPFPVEFTAEFEGSWGHRYVAKLENYRYAPLSRLSA